MTTRFGGSLLSVAMFLTAVTTQSQAATICSGDLSGVVRDDVWIANGSTCSLRSATVLGSLRVEAGQQHTSVTVDRDSVITGDVTATAVNNSALFVFGNVMGDLLIGGRATYAGANGLIGGTVTVRDDITRFSLGGTVGGDVTVRNVHLRDASLAPGIMQLAIERAHIFGSVIIQDNTVTTSDPDQASFREVPIFVSNSRIAGELRVTGNTVPEIELVTGSGEVLDIQIGVAENTIRKRADCRRNTPAVKTGPLGGNIIAGKDQVGACP